MARREDTRITRLKKQIDTFSWANTTNDGNESANDEKFTALSIMIRFQLMVPLQAQDETKNLTGRVPKHLKSTVTQLSVNVYML